MMSRLKVVYIEQCKKLMAYLKSNMVYADYKWKAGDDHDNPHIKGKPDSSMLNRSEGYEMLYFINRLAKVWGWTEPMLSSCQALERVIRTKVPSSIRTHAGIKEWIEANYSSL